MSKIFLVLAFSVGAMAQSHPGWWTFAAPDSKSLIGISWQNLRTTALADAVRAELTSPDSIGIPELPCLMAARDFLIASPPLLAGANGGCTPAALKIEATAKGYRRVAYKGTDVWIPPANGASLAQLNERVVLVGARKSLEAVIDRSLAEERSYSPLLMAGARLLHSHDLWIVAAELPDPLAGIFLPFDIPEGGGLHNFEGGLSAREGLNVNALVDASTDREASNFVASIRKSIPELPAVARAVQVAANGHNVAITLQVDKVKLQAAIRQPGNVEADRAPVSPASPKIEAARPLMTSLPHVEASKPAPAPTEPQIIRIFGLDEGVREVILRPKQP